MEGSEAMKGFYSVKEDGFQGFSDCDFWYLMEDDPVR